jgi:Ran GTPase-activating protein (RanGAP) involved in mRNA processing and transport
MKFVNLAGIKRPREEGVEVNSNQVQLNVDSNRQLGFQRGREHYFDRMKSKKTKKDLSDIIQQSFKENNAIMELSGMELGPEDAKQISSAIGEKDSLRVVDLGYNNIKSEGLISISEAIKTKQEMDYIDFFDNGITDKGVKVFANSLRESNCDVKALSFASNYISGEGIGELMNGTNVQELYVGGNNLGDKDASDISKALESNNVLKELDLTSTNLSDKGAKNILQSLRKNKTLLQIDFSDNFDIKEETCDAIERALASNRNLASFSKKKIEGLGGEAKTNVDKLQISRQSSASGIDIS